MTAEAPQPAPKSGDPLIGRTLGGRYRLLSLVARGGMGKVYRAEQQPLGRIVAVKVLDVDGQDQSDFEPRFFREAEVSSKLSHPNTVRVFDYGQTDDDVYYIVMEFVHGVTLKAIMKAEGPMPAARLVPIMRQICGSLGEAHASGVIHRDLKPSNILLTRHGEDRDFVKVLDFGLVKQLKEPADQETTRTGYILGSPMYMSPEQVRGKRVGPASDQYALGVIMYRALSGRPPFVRDSALSLLMSHVRHAPPPLSTANEEIEVNEAVESVVMTCLAKGSEERFGSMSELARALRACESDLAGLVPGGLGPLLVTDGRAMLPDSLDTLLTRYQPTQTHPPTSQRTHAEGPGGMTQSTVPVVSLFVGMGALLLLLGVVILATVLGVWAYSHTGDAETTASVALTDPPGEAAPGSTEPAATPDPNTAQRPEATPPTEASDETLKDTKASEKPTEATARPRTTWEPPPVPSQNRPRTTSATPNGQADDTPSEAAPPVPTEEDDWARPSDIRDPWGD